MKTEQFRLVSSSRERSGEAAYSLTIAVPTFRRPALLEATLRSIAALEIDIALEVIVVDNDPEGDDAAASELIGSLIAGAYKYYRNIENVGMFGNWNQCLCLAKGKYITILHDDDLLCANFGGVANQLLKDNVLPSEIVGLQVKMLEQREERMRQVTPVAGDEGTPNPAVERTSQMARASSLTVVDLFFSNRFCGTLAVIFNREYALALGGFNADWYPIADYEFWCRWASKFGAIAQVSEDVALYRIAQNESLKLDTRTAFATKSQELRLYLVEQNAVPAFLRNMIPLIGYSQRIQIYKDWRTPDEPAVPLAVRVLNLLCFKCFGVMSSVVGMFSTNSRKNRAGNT